MSTILYGNFRIELLQYAGARVDRLALPAAPPAFIRRPALVTQTSVAALLGRDDQLDQIRSAIQARQPMEFTATCGYGKSALLRHVPGRPAGRWRKTVAVAASAAVGLFTLIDAVKAMTSTGSPSPTRPVSTLISSASAPTASASTLISSAATPTPPASTPTPSASASVISTTRPPVALRPPVVTVTDFGSVDVTPGQAPVTQPVAVSNPNAKPPPVTSVEITGDPAFSVAADSCTAARIPSNGSCFVTIQFAPTSIGSHRAVLTVTSTVTKPSPGKLTGTRFTDLQIRVNGPGSVHNGQGDICPSNSAATSPSTSPSPSPTSAVCNIQITTPNQAAVTLTETPDSSGYFEAWDGACSGTKATCSLTISVDRVVYAAFVGRNDHPTRPQDTTCARDQVEPVVIAERRCRFGGLASFG